MSSKHSSPTISLGVLPESGLVDSPEAMVTLMDKLYGQPTVPPSLYIDLEGVNLSRHGTISILQVFVSPTNQTYLVDVHTLRDKAFSTPGTHGQTLREILESNTIPKVFFDVRRDSDALYHHFQINLAGIWDLQLMELVTRKFSKRLLNGLAKCIEKDAVMSQNERDAWTKTKNNGLQLFAPERGGRYEVFNDRPLPEETRLYCIQDVKFLPKLWAQYKDKMSIA